MSEPVSNKKRFFCTLFDSNYLFKGLALYESLQKHGAQFELFILCMNDEAQDILQELRLPNVKLISLEDIEDEELKQIKPTRTAVEYCWTLTPSLPMYILKQFPEVDMISYIDADCFFFSSPEPLFEEMGSDSSLIIEHRYSPQYRFMEQTSGRFNVGLLTFKRDDRGLAVLNWWRERCNEWCYYRNEEGKFGDQYYLNEFPTRFEGVHILKHLGGCVAPWNIHQYKVHSKNGRAHVDSDTVVFYHFHGFKWHNDLTYTPAANYHFNHKTKSLLYKPYSTSLIEARRRVQTIRPGFNKGLESEDYSERLKAAASRTVRAKNLARRAFNFFKRRLSLNFGS